MLRIQYNPYAGLEELTFDDVNFVQPKGSQVRVRVLAASVNPMDWVIRRGQVKTITSSRFPRGLGGALRHRLSPARSMPVHGADRSVMCREAAGSCNRFRTDRET
jgi:hypothetical protein